MYRFSVLWCSGALVLDERINIAVFTPGGFHAPEDIAGVLMQVRLYKGGGFQLQRGQVAQLPVLRRKMQFQKISGDVGIRQERPERGIMRRGRCGVFLLTHGSSW